MSSLGCELSVAEILIWLSGVLGRGKKEGGILKLPVSSPCLSLITVCPTTNSCMTSVRHVIKVDDLARLLSQSPPLSVFCADIKSAHKWLLLDCLPCCFLPIRDCPQQESSQSNVETLFEQDKFDALLLWICACV